MKNLEQVKNIVLEIKQLLDEKYTNHVREVIIYGSFARGEATEDSDIDVIVVTDNNTDSLEVEEALDALLFQILLEENELVSVMVIPEETYCNYNSPFLLNTREEGIAV